MGVTVNEQIQAIIALRGQGVFNEWEETFVQSIKDRYEKYGEKTYLSDRQIAAIGRIHKEHCK